MTIMSTTTNLSASNVNEAQELIVKAWRILLKECQDRACYNERQRLHPILDSLERARVNLITFQVDAFGWELDKAIQADEDKKRRMKSANKHCAQLGLEIPYPEISE